MSALLHLVVIVVSAGLVGCGGQSDCVPALRESDVSVRLLSSGSHALARNDLTLDLSTRRMRGSTFEMEDGVRTVPVDTQVDAAAAEALVSHLRSVCGEPGEGESQAVAGGTTTIEVTGPDGSRHIVRQGAPMELPEGTSTVELPRDAFQRAVELFPNGR